MKKNEFAIFLVYVAMLAIALIVGLTVVKPIIETYGSSMPLNSVLLVILGLVGGVVLNSLLLGLGHLLGAKTGKYRVLKSVVLGFGFKMVDGKKKFGFSGFDGLVEETKVAPEDPKTSSLTGYIFFPVLFLFIEFIVSMILIVNAQTWEKTTPGLAWVHILMVTVITVGGIIFLYDLFPARIDSRTDGFLLVLMSKPINKEAFNNILLAEEAEFLGQPIPNTPIYSEVTEFTAAINLISVYRLLGEGKPEEALPILEPFFAEGSKAAKSTQDHATTLKLATLLEQPRKEKAKALYEELSDEQKRYISTIPNVTALRCYALIASFLEADENEVNYALDKAEKLIKAGDKEFREVEKSLLQMDKEIIQEEHPSWDLNPLPWEEQPAEE